VFAVCIQFACGGHSSQPAAPRGIPGDVEVVVTGLRNDVGMVRLLLFFSPNGFPEDVKKADRRVAVPIHGGVARATFPRVASGYVAVALLHDEDNDAATKKNFVGVPQEGFGFSRNPKIGLSAPDFDECKLLLPPGGQIRTEIRVIYM
jgi:uncharacterized protein (DUF2141 family)